MVSRDEILELAERFGLQVTKQGNVLKVERSRNKHLRVVQDEEQEDSVIASNWNDVWIILQGAALGFLVATDQVKGASKCRQ